jgi:5'-nucleotidase
MAPEPASARHPEQEAGVPVGPDFGPSWSPLLRPRGLAPTQNSSNSPIPGGTGPRSLHGSLRDSPRAPEALEAEKRATALLSDPDLGRLLLAPREKRELNRAREIFVNRNLRMDKIELVGFDMDYTLAIYHLRRIEQLSFDMTLRKLIDAYNYPDAINGLKYDHQFGMRGIAVDKQAGNLVKMDRFGHIGRALHGRTPLSQDTWHKLYRNELIRPKNPRYAWLDTLFALPEACLFAGMIDLLEPRGHTFDYGKLYDDIREAIDTVHRDNSLKSEIRKDIGHYVFKDPELSPTLHKLRSGGKRLFLLTNSMWDYTNAIMGYMLDGVVAEYPSWRNYFDIVITGASKPGFFGEGQPFVELDVNGNEARILGEASQFERGKAYQGGSLSAFERMSGFAGEKVLYVGDHIYGDILKSKKTSLWRTCMVVQEIEDEIAYTISRQEEITRLSEIELLRVRLDDEINQRKTLLNAIERRLDKAVPDQVAEIEAERIQAKADLDKLRKTLKESIELADTLERDVEEGFNREWGLLFKEGSENSRFGEQVEQYACLYTSRVSNFLPYSPMQYFRSPRELMPHEHAGAPSAKMSPLGSEGPAPAAQKLGGPP